MRKIFVIYEQGGKTKKGVLDENLLRSYRINPTIKNLVEYENEMLMEQDYATRLGKNNGKKKLFG